MSGIDEDKFLHDPNDYDPEEDLKRILRKPSLFQKAVEGTIRGVARGLLRVFFRLEVSGLEHFKTVAGKNQVIIANHISYLDGLAMAVMMPGRPAFAMSSNVYKKMTKNKAMRWLFDSFGIVPISAGRFDVVATLSRVAAAGRPVMIFPEGRLTTDGNMMQIKAGAAMVADEAKASLVPVYLEGFERLKGLTPELERVYNQRRFPKLRIKVRAPEQLDLGSTTGKERTENAVEQLREIMHKLPIDPPLEQPTLFQALWQAAENHGFNSTAMISATGYVGYSYRAIIKDALRLSASFARHSEPGENVGLLLPNGTDAVNSFFGLQAAGRVPAMLSPRMSTANLASVIKTAGIKNIITSKKMLTPELTQICAEQEPPVKIKLIEDLRKKIPVTGRIAANWALRSGTLPIATRKATDPAVIFFTAGSTGVPKGVALSHANLLSNIEQVKSRAGLNPNDRVFNAMPMAHSIGLTCGMLIPLISGACIQQYREPYNLATAQDVEKYFKGVARAIYDFDTRVLIGSDSFLNGVADVSRADNFNNVRLIFSGAEKLQDSTRQRFIDSYDKFIYEGYGTAEAAPIIAMNRQGDRKHGTVGKFLPGLEVRLEEAAGTGGSRLFVRGPNVGLGYYKNDQPGVLQPITDKDGWFDTGDIVRVDTQGFVSYIDKASNFVQQNNATVSLSAIEQSAKQLWPEAKLAAMANAAGGITLFTDNATMNNQQAVQSLLPQHAGLGAVNLDVRVIEHFPILASTEKPDRASLSLMLANAAEIVVSRASAVTVVAPQIAKAKPAPAVKTPVVKTIEAK